MTEETLPINVSLAALFTKRERVFPNDSRLLTAYDRNHRPCIIAIEPLQSVRVARFASEVERDTWLKQIKALVSGRLSSSSSGNMGGAPPMTAALWRGKA